MADGFTHVDHDELSFRCRVDGPGGSAPWVVFSNSLVTDLTVWDAQVEALKARFNILRYDQRGHGGTTVPKEPCNFDELGSDAVALIDHFGISKCIFVGLSMGVPTALYVYRNRPELIERLVLCDGQAATAATGSGMWQQRIDEARAGGMAAVADEVAGRWFSEAFRAKGGDEKAKAVIASMELEGYVACARALQRYDFSDVIGTIKIPVLFMAGANDGNMPVSMQSLADTIPGAEFRVIPDAGHIPNYEQPETFNSHLLKFLQA